MSKNNWARDAFRKAQNLMSRGYTDFEPSTVVTKNDLSNLKQTLLDDDQIYLDNKTANNWTDLDSDSNSMMEASNDAGVATTYPFTEDTPIEVFAEEVQKQTPELISSPVSFFDDISLEDMGDDGSFVLNIWGPHYQTDNSIIKNAEAFKSLQKDWSVPESEKPAQELAAHIFAEDSGYSYNDILGFLGRIGQVESGYKGIEQIGDLAKGEKAWSYYQVEPKTALSLLTDSAVLFGPKFETAFKHYATKGGSARQSLANMSKEEIADLLGKDSKLAAALATAKVIATTRKNK